MDGKPVEIGRVNYVLRAIKVPAGAHTIEFKFDPQSLHVTNTLGVTAVILIYVLCVGAIGWWIFRYIRRNERRAEELKEK